MHNPQIISAFFFFITNDITFFFFFNDTATTEIYTLSLHDALPICRRCASRVDSSTTPAAITPARTRVRRTAQLPLLAPGRGGAGLATTTATTSSAPRSE